MDDGGLVEASGEKGCVYSLSEDGHELGDLEEKGAWDEENPVLQYLDSIGYSTCEVWMGQEATKGAYRCYLSRNGRQNQHECDSEGVVFSSCEEGARN